jgi:DNA-binding transcriptional MerR regulator
MKMKELEVRTGVGREAIRNYIREGLLPEPEKPRRNVAHYNETHVARINLIRKLKDERFLPLKVIRDLLDDPAVVESSNRNLEGFEALLTERLFKPELRPVPLTEVMATTSVTDEDLEFLKAEGFITVLTGPEGPALSAEDARLIQICAQLQDIGFDEETGYLIEGLTKYKASADALAKSELEEFFEHIPNNWTSGEAVSVAEQGIELTGQVHAILRSKAIVRLLAERTSEDVH